MVAEPGLAKTYMNGRALVDTNVLVYAYDRSEPEKQVRTLDVLDQLEARRAGVISSQMLGEFFVAVTRRIAAPLTVAEAYERMLAYVSSWPTLSVTPATALEAARGVRDHRLSYWDAQVWAAAKLNQVAVILSEDCNPGASIEGVRYVNPFAEGFDLGAHLHP